MDWVPPNDTDISEEMPEYLKIPGVGVRPPQPKQRRIFPDTIDLEPQGPIDPELDDSAVSIDCPTWMQENKHIGIRPQKPRWQVRMSQELFWKDIFAGDLTEEQILAAGEQLKIPWESEGKIYKQKLEDVPKKKIIPKQHGAEQRKKRSLTYRDRVLRAEQAATDKRLGMKLRASQKIADVNDFDSRIEKFGRVGLTELDMIAVGKDVNESLTLFL